MKASIDRLGAHRKAIESAYGRAEDVVVYGQDNGQQARFVLSLREMAELGGQSVTTLAELERHLQAALDSIPAQASA